MLFLNFNIYQNLKSIFYIAFVSNTVYGHGLLGTKNTFASTGPELKVQFQVCTTFVKPLIKLAW